MNFKSIPFLLSTTLFLFSIGGCGITLSRWEKEWVNWDEMLQMTVEDRNQACTEITALIKEGYSESGTINPPPIGTSARAGFDFGKGFFDPNSHYEKEKERMDALYENKKVCTITDPDMRTLVQRIVQVKGMDFEDSILLEYATSQEKDNDLEFFTWSPFNEGQLLDGDYKDFNRYYKEYLSEWMVNRHNGLKVEGHDKHLGSFNIDKLINTYSEIITKRYPQRVKSLK